MTETPEFWPAVAQVAPVLALALTIEARFLITRAGKSSGGWFERRWLPLVMTLALIGLAWTELTALQVLSGSSAGSQSDEWVIGWISLSLGLLVINPALDLFVAANADVLVKFLGRSPLLRLRIKLIRGQTKRLIRKTLEAQSEGENLLARNHALERRIRDMHHAIRAERDRTEDAEKIETIDAFLAEFESDGLPYRSDDELEAEMVEYREEMEATRARAKETRDGWRESSDNLKAESAEQREKLAKEVRKTIRNRWKGK
jgi:hypothetical protein